MAGIAFFDLDGTILGGVSSENAFFFHLLRKRYFGLRQFFAAVLYIFRWFPKFKWYVFIKDKAYLAGLSVEKVEQLAQQYVQEHLSRNVRERIKALVVEHQKAGDHVVLLTGAPYFLADALAKDLGISDVQATVCVQRAGRFTVDPPTQHPFAQEKEVIAKRICEERGVHLRDCSAYGNSIYDKFILGCVGCPVAVTPNHSLRKLAQHKGWKIVD